MIYWRKIGYRVTNLLFLYKVLLIAFGKIACPAVPLTYLFFPQVKYINKAKLDKKKYKFRGEVEF